MIPELDDLRNAMRLSGASQVGGARMGELDTAKIAGWDKFPRTIVRPSLTSEFLSTDLQIAVNHPIIPNLIAISDHFHKLTIPEILVDSGEDEIPSEDRTRFVYGRDFSFGRRAGSLSTTIQNASVVEHEGVPDSEAPRVMQSVPFETPQHGLVIVHLGHDRKVNRAAFADVLRIEEDELIEPDLSRFNLEQDTLSPFVGNYGRRVRHIFDQDLFVGQTHNDMVITSSDDPEFYINFNIRKYLMAMDPLFGFYDLLHDVSKPVSESEVVAHDKFAESATGPQKYWAGGIEMELDCPPGVMKPSPYSRLIAHSIPGTYEGTFIDIGTGSGVLAIVAKRRGARSVYLTDINNEILAVAQSNIDANGDYNDAPVSFFTDASLLPDPLPTDVDWLICNPASLPLPPDAEVSAPYGSGEDGRQMIDQVLTQTPRLIHAGAKLLLAHTSLANTARTIEELERLDLDYTIVDSREFSFRPFYNREWIDGLGGQEAGLYFLRDGVPYERVDIFEITSRRRR